MASSGVALGNIGNNPKLADRPKPKLQTKQSTWPQTCYLFGGACPWGDARADGATRERVLEAEQLPLHADSARKRRNERGRTHSGTVHLGRITVSLKGGRGGFARASSAPRGSGLWSGSTHHRPTPLAFSCYTALQMLHCVTGRVTVAE